MEGFIQANTNGRLHDAREAAISPLDRGFLYGDAVYEVWRTYGGGLFAAREHWQRLEASAAGLGMILPLEFDRLLDEIRRTIAAARRMDGWGGERYVRLQVSRGAGAIGLDPELAKDRGLWTILIKPLEDLTDVELDAGLKVGLASVVRRNDLRTLPPGLKTGNYLNNVLALREAIAAGAQEVLMVNLAGNLTEGSVRNFWFVEGDTAVTPPLGDGLLAGVTRRFLFEQVGPAAKMKLREATLRPDDIPRFAECFATSTTQDIAPVASIGAHRFKRGAATFTRRLKTAFRAFVEKYNQSHPDLKVG